MKIKVELPEQKQVIEAGGERAERLWKALKDNCFADRLLPDGRIEMHVLSMTNEALVRVVEVA